MSSEPGAKREMRVLAVSSSGGHWEQLMLLREAFADCEVVYATTLSGLAERSGVGEATIIPDFNAQKPVKTLLSLWSIFKLVLGSKADAIVSTGAAPGFVALTIGRVMGKHTIWIDSIANSERLSMSGSMIRRIAHLRLTQWEHLARPEGPLYAGAVL